MEATEVTVSERDLMREWRGVPEPLFVNARVRELRAVVTEGGLTFFAGDDRNVGLASEAGLHAICQEVIQPLDFVTKLSPELRAAVYNERFQVCRDREVLLIVEGGHINALMPGDREVLPRSEVADLVLDTFGDVVGSPMVDHYSTSERGMHLRLLSDVVRPVTPKVGDAMALGIEARHSYGGEQEVSLYLRRLICLNGMTAVDSAFSWRSPMERTRSHQRDFFRDGVVRAMEAYQGVVDRAVEMAAAQVANPEQALLERAAAVGVPQRHHAALLDAWRVEEDASEWGLLNSISRVATHAGLPGNLGRRLQAAAGSWVQEFDMVNARMPRPIAHRVGAHIIEDINGGEPNS